MQGGGVEGRLEGAHLIEQDTQRPDVGFERVRGALDYLRGEIIRCADDSFGFRSSIWENSCNTEISKFHNVLLCQEYILWLQISMQDLAIMAVLQRQAYLREPVKHLVLREVLHLPRRLPFLVLLLDPWLQVSPIGVVHDDAQFPFLRLVHLPKPDDVRVLQHFQDLGLTQRLFTLVFAHLGNVYLLNHCVLAIRVALYQVGRAERTCTQGWNFLVGLVGLLRFFASFYHI